MEDNITFASDDLTLEGLYHPSNSEKGVVITHPHSLYGGDMHNTVVSLVARAYQNKNYSTLRFNFRGVGHSGGRFADGVGEQKDVYAALADLHEKGLPDVALAGYSFGAWVNAHINPEAVPLAHMTMVSPPVAFIEFGAIAALPHLRQVIVGDRDDIAPLASVREMLPTWNPAAILDVVAGADHFFSGCDDRLVSILEKRITPA